MSKLRPHSPARPAAALAVLGGLIQIAVAAASLAGARVGEVDFGAFNPVLVVVLALSGAGAIAAGVYAARGVRIAWGYSVSLHGTLFLVFLFATPTLRDVGAPVGVALAPALLTGVITTLFALAGPDYG